MITGRDLKHGEFFQHQSSAYPNTIGRRVNNTIVCFDMGITVNGQISSVICEYFSSWQYAPVEPIDFQTAFLALVQECTEHPQEEKELKNEIIPPENLPKGYWFWDKHGNVGRRCQDVFAFLFQTSENVCGFSPTIGPITPLTRQQALLRIAQNIILLEQAGNVGKELFQYNDS